MKTVRIFVSSPGDVGAEREKAREIFDRLQTEFSGVLEIAPYYWESDPIRAHADPQSQIEPPSKFDVFVCLLWARLGSKLHPGLHRKADGGEYASGTEYEVLDALEGWRRSQAPQVLVYKRKTDPVIPVKPKDEREKVINQYDALQDFVARLTKEGEFFVRGSNSYAGLDQFEEKFETHMRKVLEGFLDPGVVTSRHVPKSWTKGSPFRGLRHFDFEHAAIFFGRTRAIEEVLWALKQQAMEERAFVLIFGGSGVGKSSLARAGVLPWLVKPGVIDGVALWRRGVMRPSEVDEGDLFDALASSLLRGEGLPEIGSDGTTLEQLAAMLRKNPGGVGDLMRFALSRAAREVQLAEKLPSQPRALFALLIDQLEELFTVERLAGQRDDFLRALDALARSGFVWVMATLRSDFYPRCEESTILMELKKGAGQYHLQPPDESQLGQMIRLPAAAAGLLFEENHKTGERLEDLLRDATVQSPAALPLLEFALEELYEQRDPNRGLLTLEVYNALGGVEGALGKRAKESFHSASENAQESFDQVFRQLVTISTAEGEPAVRRRARKDEVEANAGARELVERLTTDRLLVADRTKEGTVVLALAHEAMLGSWPHLKEWVQRNRESLKVRAQVAADTQRWIESNRSADYLYGTGLPLEKARVAERGGFLDLEERGFVEESGRHVAAAASRRLRVLRRWLVAVTGIAVIAAVMFVLALWKRAEAVKANAKSLQTLHEASTADYAVAVQRIEKDGKWHEGLAHLIRALQWEPKNVWAAQRLYYTLATHATEQQNWPRLVLPHDASEDAQFSPDGKTILTASQEGTVRIWDSASGKLLRQLAPHQGPVTSALFSPDSTRIITISSYRWAQLWNAVTGEVLGKPLPHGDAINDARFSPDGARIVTASDDRTARIWDSATGNPLSLPYPHANNVVSAQFSPDGAKILTASFRGGALVWDGASGKALGGPFLQGGDDIRYAEFSPDGTHILTVSRGKIVQVWDAETFNSIGNPIPSENLLTSAQFNPDGTRILTVSHKSARIWDAATGEALGNPFIEDSGISFAQFSPDGTRLVTACGNGNARVWDTFSGAPIGAPLPHESVVNSARFSPNGTRLVTASPGKSCVWDAPTRAISGEPFRHGGEVNTAQFSPDGSQIATASSDSDVRIWNAATHRPIGGPLRHKYGVSSAQYSPDSTRIVTASNYAAYIWDVATGKVLGGPLPHGDTGVVLNAQFSPDNTRIVTASGYAARIWDSATGKALGEPLSHKSPVEFAQFSPDGARVITASDRETRIWATVTHKLLNKHRFLAGIVKRVRFSPDGTRIVTASSDKTAQIWDVATGKAVGEPFCHTGTVNDAQFSPDGTRIVTASSDKTARIWDVATGKALGEPFCHASKVNGAQFSPDGTRIITACDDDTARVWDAAKLVPAPIPVPEWMLTRASAIAGLAFDKDGKLVQIPPEKRLVTLQSPQAGSTSWVVLAHWLVEPAGKRKITPNSRYTIRQIAERERDTLLQDGSEAALRLDPTVPLARLLLAEKERDPARARFLRKYDLEHLPNDARLWARASRIFRDQGEKQLELGAAERAVALDSSIPDANRALADALEGDGRRADAWPIREKLLADARATAEDFQAAGYSAAILGRAERAREIFRAAEEKFPEATGVVGMEAWALLNLNAPREALQAFSRFVSISKGEKKPTDATAGLAASRWLTGDRDGAVREYRQLILGESSYARVNKFAGWTEIERSAIAAVLEETLKRHPDLTPVAPPQTEP